MASSLTLPELSFCSPDSILRRRITVSKIYASRSSFSRSPRYGATIRTRIWAVKEGVVVEESKKKVNGVELNGNGAAGIGREDYFSNGNGGMTNGSLVKDVNGNGAPAEAVAEAQVLESKEDGRKKRIEEIGQEDAWFKKNGQSKVEV